MCIVHEGYHNVYCSVRCGMCNIADREGNLARSRAYLADHLDHCNSLRFLVAGTSRHVVVGGVAASHERWEAKSQEASPISR